MTIYQAQQQAYAQKTSQTMTADEAAQIRKQDREELEAAAASRKAALGRKGTGADLEVLTATVKIVSEGILDQERATYKATTWLQEQSLSDELTLQELFAISDLFS
jgi:hypothetical protein